MRISHSKRVVSAIVALSMILTMMSGLSFSTVNAATTVSVNTWASLKTALQTAGDVNVKITEDFDFEAASAEDAINNCISVSSGNKTIDLNNKSISFIVESFEYMEVSDVPKSPITVSGTASLTVKDSGTYGIFNYIANKSEHYAFTAPKQSGGMISVSDTATVKVENTKLNNVAIGPCINVTGGSPNVILDGAKLSTGSDFNDWSGGFALFISDATTKPSITMSNKSELRCTNTNAILSAYSNGSGAMYVGNYNTVFTIDSVILRGTVQARVSGETATKLPFVSVSTHQVKVNKIIHITDAEYLLGPVDFDVSADSTEETSKHYHMVIVEKITVDGKETTNSQSIMTEITKLSDVVEEKDTFDSVVSAFEGAYGATEVDYSYNFATDFANADLVAGTTYFKDKFTPSAGSAESSITVTSDITAKMKGFTQFYSDVRWTSASELSFDLKMVSSGENFAGFYVKYGKEIVSGDKSTVFFSNDGVRADSANSTTGTTGIGFSFRTINNKPCIEIFVKYLDSNGKLSVKGNYYYDVVKDLKSFNNYRVTDDNNGTIKFYANDILFATLICSDAQVPTANKAYTETYYSTVKIMDAQGKTVDTVSNALVSTSSAIAFGTRNETLELDNFEAKDKTNTDPKVDGATLVLENDITISFLVSKSQIEGTGYTNLKLYVYSDRSGLTVLEPKFGVVNGVEGYIFYYQNVGAFMMNDQIRFVVYAELDGEVYASTPKEYSVAAYAYYTLSLPETYASKELKTLIVDMLRFGSAVQIYQNYKTDELVDAKLTAEQAAYGTQTVREFVNHLISPTPDNSNTGEVGGAKITAAWKLITLVIDNKIKIQPVFAIDSTEGICVKVNDTKGNLVQTILPSGFTEITLPDGTKGYTFIFDKMTVSNLSDEYCFTVYNSYDQEVSGTLVYSAESYAYANQNNTTVNGLANVVKTMMLYGDSNVAYRNSLG